MGLTPVTPAFGNFSPKSFWKRPEGKPGLLLTAGVAGLGIYGLFLALPILTAVVWGTVNLAIGAIVLGVIGYIVTNRTVQCLVKNIFQSICRGVAMVYTTIDPIGILKNNLDDMRKAKGELDKTIQRFAGSDNNLVTKIKAKNDEITGLGAKSNAAARMLASKKDPDEQERIQLQKETFEQKAGMLMQGVQQLQALETQTRDMLDKFRHWSRISDAKIDRTAMKVEFYADQRSTILDAQKTLGVGMRLLKGDPEQLKLVDGAIEFLSEDAARTIGEIQEFNRFSDRMLTDIDIENSANAENARKKFAEFGVRLDEDAKRPSAVDQLQAMSRGALPAITASPAGRQNTVSVPADYGDMFKR